MSAFEKPFEQLKIGKSPVILAPLAGVSDHPFRRTCVSKGADYSFVEMISSAALIHNSQRTLEMLKRHESEAKLGVQITGRSAAEVAKAVGILGKMNFDSIDINMGCPVAKVVTNGCGSAILKDPRRVYETVHACRQETDLPLTAKIRIGWDRKSINACEVADAAEKGGADWLCVHGRTRSDDYSAAVDLQQIAAVKKAVKIPVIGNGNIFSYADAVKMQELTHVDGWMLSRGALGDPWLFARIKAQNDHLPTTVEDWAQTIRTHLQWQREEYGDKTWGHICMRKHLLWYLKGFAGMTPFKNQINQTESIDHCLKIIDCIYSALHSSGVLSRMTLGLNEGADSRFQWDPKFEMDRKLDRGVGDDQLDEQVGAT